MTVCNQILTNFSRRSLASLVLGMAPWMKQNLHCKPKSEAQFPLLMSLFHYLQMMIIFWLASLGKSLTGLLSSAIKCTIRSGKKRKEGRGKISTKFLTRQLAPWCGILLAKAIFDAPMTPKMAQSAGLHVSLQGSCRRGLQPHDCCEYKCFAGSNIPGGSDKALW